jgi:hypothetical protein
MSSTCLRRCELTRREREDLLLVLGVGAGGEPVDPPPRVRLPQIVARHARQRTVACMKFSVWPSPERAWSEIASLARTAEAQGWHGLWFADHLMPNSEDGEPLDGDVFECWSILAAVGAITTGSGSVRSCRP